MKKDRIITSIVSILYRLDKPTLRLIYEQLKHEYAA